MIGLLMLAREMIRGAHAAPRRSDVQIDLSGGKYRGREGGYDGGKPGELHTGHSLVRMIPDQRSQSVIRATGRSENVK